MADALPYPCSVVVHCDLCPAAHRGDYFVLDSDSKETRCGFARAHLRTQGWRCDETGDYCPDHPSPQPSTEDNVTDRLHTELLRLINERGVTDLDADDLANDVTQLFHPDNPGCWAEDEQAEGFVLNQLPDKARQIVKHLRVNGFDIEHAQQRQVLCLAEEVGEFVGAYRRWSGQARRSGTAEEMHAELADVVITAFAAAEEFGVSLEELVGAKLTTVFSRGWRETPSAADHKELA